MASRLNPTNFGYQNFYSATLTGDITSGSLTIGLDTVPTPTSGILVIEPDSTTNREVILYTGKTASTITLPSDGRGFDGSTAVSHLTGTTIIYAPVKRILDALASGELSTDPLRTEAFLDFVASGAIWSGDAYASTRNASMSAGVVYIGGRRLTLAAVSARTFTASKDTYVDAADNLDGTATLTYTEVTNNAASPVLATNNFRLGIIVTGASNIADVGSINQGQENKVLPITGGFPYCVNDSLGNRINRRRPYETRIGTFRKTSAAAFPGTIYGTYLQVIGTSRGSDVNIDIDLVVQNGSSGSTRSFTTQVLCDGVAITTPGTYLLTSIYAGAEYPQLTYKINFSHQPTAGSHTWAVQILASAGSAVGIQPNSKVTVREES